MFYKRPSKNCLIRVCNDAANKAPKLGKNSLFISVFIFPFKREEADSKDKYITY